MIRSNDYEMKESITFQGVWSGTRSGSSCVTCFLTYPWLCWWVCRYLWPGWFNFLTIGSCFWYKLPLELLYIFACAGCLGYRHLWRSGKKGK